MTMPQHDPNLLAYLQAWRQYLEQVAGAAVAPGFSFPVMPQIPSPAMALVPPPLPPMPPGFASPMPPVFSPPPTQPAVAPADHTVELLTALQAWRRFLEQSLGVADAGRAEPATDTTSRREKDRVPPLIDDAGRATDTAADPGRTPPWPAPGHQTPAPRVGSAYAPESGAGTYGGPTETPPRSLYSAAATPDPGPATTWWDSDTATGAAAPPSGTQQAEPTATATGTADGPGGSAAAKWPPKYESIPARIDDSSQNPRIYVSAPPANALATRRVAPDRPQVPSLPRLSR